MLSKRKSVTVRDCSEGVMAPCTSQLQTCHLLPCPRNAMGTPVMLTSSAHRIANLKIQLAKLDSEAWPGVLDSERDRLILISEKEELLKEMRFVSPRKWTQGEVEQLEMARKRLEKDLQAARDTQSKALTERWAGLGPGGGLGPSPRHWSCVPAGWGCRRSPCSKKSVWIFFF